MAWVASSARVFHGFSTVASLKQNTQRQEPASSRRFPRFFDRGLIEARCTPCRLFRLSRVFHGFSTVARLKHQSLLNHSLRRLFIFRKLRDSIPRRITDGLVPSGVNLECAFWQVTCKSGGFRWSHQDSPRLIDARVRDSRATRNGQASVGRRQPATAIG